MGMTLLTSLTTCDIIDATMNKGTDLPCFAGCGASNIAVTERSRSSGLTLHVVRNERYESQTVEK